MNEKHPLPATTGDQIVVTLYEWLRGRLREMDFGEVGLVFTVHDSVIVKVSKIENQRCAVVQT